MFTRSGSGLQKYKTEKKKDITSLCQRVKKSEPTVDRNTEVNHSVDFGAS